MRQSRVARCLAAVGRYSVHFLKAATIWRIRTTIATAACVRVGVLEVLQLLLE